MGLEYFFVEKGADYMKSRKVYFLNKYHETKREIGECDSLEDGEKIIQDFLDEKGFNAPYWRYWKNKDGWKYDVGSHSEFFTIEEV